MDQELVVAPSMGQKVGAIAAVAFSGAIVAPGALYIMLRPVFNVPNANELFLTWVIPTVIVGAVIGLVAGLSAANRSVVVTPYELRLMRGSKVWRSFDRRTHAFSSHVTVTRYNGVRSGVSRQIIVSNEAGSAPFPVALDQARFSLLMNAINPPTQLVENLSPELRNSTPPTITYQINTRAARSAAFALRNVMLPMLIVFTLGFAVLVYTVTDGDALLTAYIAGGLGVMLAIPMIAGQIAGAARARRIPSTLTVSAAGLQVDHDLYDYNMLSSISLTPPEYDLNNFEIGLSGTFGGRVLFLGTARKKYKAFPEYDAFLAHLIHATMNRPGLVALQLG